MEERVEAAAAAASGGGSRSLDWKIQAGRDESAVFLPYLSTRARAADDLHDDGELDGAVL